MILELVKVQTCWTRSLSSLNVLFEILFLCLNYETEWQQCIIIHCQFFYFYFFAEVNGFLLGWLILNVIGWEMVSQYDGGQGLACWNSVCKYSVCGCASISLYFVSACVFEFDVFMFTFVTSFLCHCNAC